MRRIPVPRPKQTKYSPQDTRDLKTDHGASQVNEEFRRIAAAISNTQDELKKQAGAVNAGGVKSPVGGNGNTGGGNGGGGTGGGTGNQFTFNAVDTTTVDHTWQNNILSSVVKPNSIGLTHLTNQVRFGVQDIIHTPTIRIEKLHSGSVTQLQQTRAFLRINNNVSDSKGTSVTTKFVRPEFTTTEPYSGISLPIKFKDSTSITFGITADGEVTATSNSIAFSPGAGLQWNPLITTDRILDANVDGSIVITTGTEADFDENYIVLKNDLKDPKDTTRTGATHLYAYSSVSDEKGWYQMPDTLLAQGYKNSIEIDNADNKVQLVGDVLNASIYSYYGTDHLTNSGNGIKGWKDVLKMPFWKMFGNTVEEIILHEDNLNANSDDMSKYFLGVKDVLSQADNTDAYAPLSLGVENTWYIAMFPQLHAERTNPGADKRNLRGIAFNRAKLKGYNPEANEPDPVTLLGIRSDVARPEIAYVEEYPAYLFRNIYTGDKSIEVDSESNIITLVNDINNPDETTNNNVAYIYGADASNIKGWYPIPNSSGGTLTGVTGVLPITIGGTATVPEVSLDYGAKGSLGHPIYVFESPTLKFRNITAKDERITITLATNGEIEVGTSIEPNEGLKWDFPSPDRGLISINPSGSLTINTIATVDTGLLANSITLVNDDEEPDPFTFYGVDYLQDKGWRRLTEAMIHELATVLTKRSITIDPEYVVNGDNEGKKLQLVGDLDVPSTTTNSGVTHVYGYSPGGLRGWYPTPSVSGGGITSVTGVAPIEVSNPTGAPSVSLDYTSIGVGTADLYDTSVSHQLQFRKIRGAGNTTVEIGENNEIVISSTGVPSVTHSVTKDVNNVVQLVGDNSDVTTRYRYYGVDSIITGQTVAVTKTWHDLLKIPFLKVGGNTYSDYLMHSQLFTSSEYFFGFKDIVTGANSDGLRNFTLGVENDWYIKMHPSSPPEWINEFNPNIKPPHKRRGVALNPNKIRHWTAVDNPGYTPSLVLGIEPTNGYVETYPVSFFSYEAGDYIDITTKTIKANVIIPAETAVTPSTIYSSGSPISITGRIVKAASGSSITVNLIDNEIVIGYTGGTGSGTVGNVSGSAPIRVTNGSTTPNVILDYGSKGTNGIVPYVLESVGTSVPISTLLFRKIAGSTHIGVAQAGTGEVVISTSVRSPIGFYSITNTAETDGRIPLYLVNDWTDTQIRTDLLHGLNTDGDSFGFYGVYRKRSTPSGGGATVITVGRGYREFSFYGTDSGSVTRKLAGGSIGSTGDGAIEFKGLRAGSGIVLGDADNGENVQISVSRTNSIVFAGNSLQLDGDVASPALGYYYGTNRSGGTSVKGWYPIPDIDYESYLSVSVDNTERRISLVNDIGASATPAYYGFDSAGERGFHNFPPGITYTPGSAIEITDNVISVRRIHSIVIESNHLRLANDEDAPGVNKFYGTNASGQKGWQSLPSAETPYSGVAPISVDTTSRQISVNYDASITVLDGKLRLRNDEISPTSFSYYGTNSTGTIGWHSLTSTNYVGDYSVSIEPSFRRIRLAGDVETPGNNYYYGTNASGVKSFHPLPTSVSGAKNSISIDSGDGKVQLVNDIATTIDIGVNSIGMYSVYRGSTVGSGVSIIRKFSKFSAVDITSNIVIGSAPYIVIDGGSDFASIRLPGEIANGTIINSDTLGLTTSSGTALSATHVYMRGSNGSKGWVPVSLIGGGSGVSGVASVTAGNYISISGSAANPVVNFRTSILTPGIGEAQMAYNSSGDFVVRKIAAGVGISVATSGDTVTITANGGGGSGGTVTNVTGTAPIRVSNGTTTPTISLDYSSQGAGSDIWWLDDSATASNGRLWFKRLIPGTNITFQTTNYGIIINAAGGSGGTTYTFANSVNAPGNTIQLVNDRTDVQLRTEISADPGFAFYGAYKSGTSITRSFYEIYKTPESGLQRSILDVINTNKIRINNIVAGNNILISKNSSTGLITIEALNSSSISNANSGVAISVDTSNKINVLYKNSIGLDSNSLQLVNDRDSTYLQGLTTNEVYSLGVDSYNHTLNGSVVTPTRGTRARAFRDAGNVVTPLKYKSTLEILNSTNIYPAPQANSQQRLGLTSANWFSYSSGQVRGVRITKDYSWVFIPKNATLTISNPIVLYLPENVEIGHEVTITVNHVNAGAVLIATDTDRNGFQNSVVQSALSISPHISNFDTRQFWKSDANTFNPGVSPSFVVQRTPSAYYGCLSILDLCDPPSLSPSPTALNAFLPCSVILRFLGLVDNGSAGAAYEWVLISKTGMRLPPEPT